ncbi:MAG: YciI family protein [Conexibacteraceae bacterium]|nr:YciI family protein [Conexibacteraceae bacterium]
MTEPELTHVLLYQYVPDMAERRTPYREAHLHELQALRAADQLIVAGAYGDPVSGGVIGFKGLTRQEVEDWADADPYTTAGLVVERRVEPWKLV